MSPENQEQTVASMPYLVAFHDAETKWNTNTGRETNIDSIRALEKQIEKGEGPDAIKLKRARNSLLNISTRVPPEVLGYIFAWCLVRQASQWVFSRDFGGLNKGCYNFLLVCHHWFKVASQTPELWDFWGNSLLDWKKRHHRSRAAIPLDLILCGDFIRHPGNHFDESLQDAVRSRVMQGTIRQVHLRSRDWGTLASIISSLTPGGGGGRNENIESIVLSHVGDTFGPAGVDVSGFFARSRFPRLRLLDLSRGIRISSWDHLANRTTALVVLSLKIESSPPSPTLSASQLISILTRNPNLQELTLSGVALPGVTHGAAPKFPLHNLRILSLTGEFGPIFEFLDRLILSGTLDRMDLSCGHCMAEDISQTLTPYIRDHFRRDARFQDKLEVLFSSADINPTSLEVMSGGSTALERRSPYMGIRMHPTDLNPPGVQEQLFIGLIAQVPGEHVVVFSVDLGTNLPEEVFFMMPNIRTLSVTGAVLYEEFLLPNPDGPHASTKLLPSLESLCLEDVQLDDDWGHLTTFLAHRASDGQAVSLEINGGFPYMHPEVMDEIKGLVREFVYQEDAMEDELRCRCLSSSRRLPL